MLANVYLFIQKHVVFLLSNARYIFSKFFELEGFSFLKLVLVVILIDGLVLDDEPL